MSSVEKPLTIRRTHGNVSANAAKIAMAPDKRTAVAPAELPVGVVTALVGVPVFVVLLRRRAA